MTVVLYAPQIPQNTGNVVRTCSVTGFSLILVRPLGFSVNDRWLKRAGLDYWEGVKVQITDTLEALLEEKKTGFYFFSSKARKRYTDIEFKPRDWLIFGSETSGFSNELWQRWPENFYAIPMLKNSRCLNLATSVGIAVYESLRQTSFSSLTP